VKTRVELLLLLHSITLVQQSQCLQKQVDDERWVMSLYVLEQYLIWMQPAEEDTPAPTQTQRRRRDDTPEDEDVDMDDERQDTGSGSLEQLSKGLVRYALSCEHSRKPIKRQDINEKGEGMGKLLHSRANSISAGVSHTVVQRRLQPRQH
jgi:hypothetical protein